MEQIAQTLQVAVNVANRDGRHVASLPVDVVEHPDIAALFHDRQDQSMW